MTVATCRGFIKSAPTPDTSRRAILCGIPAAMAGIMAVPALAEETPVLTLFRKWLSLYEGANAANDDSEADRLTAERHAVEEHLFGLDSRSALDVLAKMLALTLYGEALDDDTTASLSIVREARAAVGGIA